MITFKGPPDKVVRNQPISSELKAVLETAAQKAGIDTINITSGGQDALGHGNRRTGSTRHDNGRAADLQLIQGGQTLTFTDQAAHPAILAFVTAAAAAGATGIGAGVGYMGKSTLHVGFGRSIGDKTTLTWGARGLSGTAPKWLTQAAQAGWSHSAAPVAAPAAGGPHNGAKGTHVVVARGGLNLRGGPGTGFASKRTLDAGTVVTVVSAHGPDPAWASIDIEGDGLLDGFVFAAYLAPIDAAGEDTPEP